MLKVLKITAVILLMVSVSYAVDTQEICIDENRLNITRNTTINIDGSLVNIITDRIINCTDGCSGGICLDAPGYHVDSYFMSSIGLMFMSIIFLILGLKTKPDEAYGMLQFFFITLSVVFGVFNLWFGSHLAENLEVIIGDSSISSVLVAAYFVGLMASIFYMFYGVIKWFISMFKEVPDEEIG